MVQKTLPISFFIGFPLQSTTHCTRDCISVSNEAFESCPWLYLLLWSDEGEKIKLGRFFRDRLLQWRVGENARWGRHGSAEMRWREEGGREGGAVLGGGGETMWVASCKPLWWRFKFGVVSA